MKPKSSSAKKLAEEVVKDTRRATRQHSSVEASFFDLARLIFSCDCKHCRPIGWRCVAAAQDDIDKPAARKVGCRSVGKNERRCFIAIS